jgi:Site-specific recombinase XerD
VRGQAKKADWRKDKRSHGGSIRERDGKVYARVQFIGEDGKRHDKEREARNRRHARELIKEMRDELKAHGEKNLNTDRMTFRELAGIYKERKLIPAIYVSGRKVAGLRSWKAPQDFLKTLIKYFGNKHIRTIKHSDVEAFKIVRLQTPTTRGHQRSIAAVNRELELLRALLRFAHREGWIFKSPFETGSSLISKVSETQRERVLTFEEENRLLSACKGRRAHLRALLVVALDTGMRRGELFKLVWSDVDFAANLIRVRATTTKTETARTVGMTPRVQEALRALHKEAPPEPKCLVFGITDTVKTAFLAACRDAGLKDFRFHDCRHTAITRMIEAGMPAAEVMKISGHTQMTTFQRYVNVNEQAARRGAELLSAHIAREEKQTILSEAVN